MYYIYVYIKLILQFTKKPQSSSLSHYRTVVLHMLKPGCMTIGWNGILPTNLTTKTQVAEKAFLLGHFAQCKAKLGPNDSLLRNFCYPCIKRDQDMEDIVLIPGERSLWSHINHFWINKQHGNREPWFSYSARIENHGFQTWGDKIGIPWFSYLKEQIVEPKKNEVLEHLSCHYRICHNYLIWRNCKECFNLVCDTLPGETQRFWLFRYSATLSTSLAHWLGWVGSW